MRNFSIGKRTESELTIGSSQLLFVVDGNRYPTSSIRLAAKEDPSSFTYQSWECHDRAVINAILGCTLDEVNDVQSILFDLSTVWHNYELTATVLSAGHGYIFDKDPIATILRNDAVVIFQLSVSESKIFGSFSHIGLAAEVEHIINRVGNLLFSATSYGSSPNSLHIRTACHDSSRLLREVIQEHVELCWPIVESAYKNLTQRPEGEEILASFQFPDEIKVPCQQYLMYFSQFLKDIGIDAEPKLTEKAGSVLFSLSPKNGTEALERIKQALSIYLNLPEADIVFGDSIQSMRLQAQIESLKHSQSMAIRENQIALRAIETQDQIIEAKDLIISQQRDTISDKQRIIDMSKPDVMMASCNERDEFVAIYEGVHVGESEFLRKHLGIGLNPVKALSAMGKSLLGKDDLCPSILDDGATKEEGK